MANRHQRGGYSRYQCEWLQIQFRTSWKSVGQRKTSSAICTPDRVSEQILDAPNADRLHSSPYGLILVRQGVGAQRVFTRYGVDVLTADNLRRIASRPGTVPCLRPRRRSRRAARGMAGQRRLAQKPEPSTAATAGSEGRGTAQASARAARWAGVLAKAFGDLYTKRVAIRPAKRGLGRVMAGFVDDYLIRVFISAPLSDHLLDDGFDETTYGRIAGRKQLTVSAVKPTRSSVMTKPKWPPRSLIGFTERRSLCCRDCWLPEHMLNRNMERPLVR